MAHSTNPFHAIPDEQDPTDDTTTTSKIESEVNIEAEGSLRINVAPTNNQQHGSQSKRVNTQALNGLRGLVALHIMIFHSLLYSKWELNTLGSVQMPLFFLISGFILALNDGKHKYHTKRWCACCCTNTSQIDDTTKASMIENDSIANQMESESQSQSETKTKAETEKEIKEFDSKNFYQRRAARTLPLYYLLNIFALPLMFLGYGSFTPDYAFECVSLTLFAATTWFGFPFVLDGPSWFVSTMWFFYWLFPCLITRFSNSNYFNTTFRKYRAIKVFYFLQWFTGLFFAFIVDYTIGGYGFYWATFWPVARLPVFLMGILAGLLRVENYYEEFLTSVRKWERINWNKMCDMLAIIFILIFVAGSIIENITNGVTSFNYWLQLLLPWWQLELIYVLTKCDENCMTYKVLTSRLMLYLGRISYSLYLVHEPMIQYIELIVYGIQSEPTCDLDADIDNACQKEWDQYDDHRLMPLYCIPILWIAAIIAAILLNRFFEEPMRKLLRPKKK